MSDEMNSAFTGHFRSPAGLVSIRTAGSASKQAGYFRFSDKVMCFGNTSEALPATSVDVVPPDVWKFSKVVSNEVQLPFELNQVARNLRCEYYAGLVKEQDTQLPPNPLVRNLYYLARPLMSVGFRKVLQRIRLRGKTSTPFPHWPVDRTVDRLFETVMSLAIQARGGRPIPFVWFWPNGAQGALILTHDVETATGRDFCGELMDMDDSFGFKSSFQVIPEKRYEVTEAYLQSLRGRGFEVNVHDLNHDGNLFRTREEFLIRAKKINEYTRQFGTAGFRSGVLYRNLRWYDAFEFSYDMSVPNVGHLDPQGGGCCTLFPYFVGNLLEIPVTATQDYSLFHILDTYSIDLWKQQCELILKGQGMISIIVHPDYVMDEKSQKTYKQLLNHLRELRESKNIWATLPREIDRWWRLRSSMTLVAEGDAWKIAGEGNERARVAYAHLREGQLVYSFDPADPGQQTIEYTGHTNSGGPRNGSGAPTNGSSAPSVGHRSSPQGSPHETVQANAETQAVLDLSITRSTSTAVIERETSAPQAATEEPAVRVARTPLRVGMVSYSFYERDNRVMRYAETLAQRGDHVDVFALQREAGMPREEMVNGVHLHRLQSRTINEKSRFSYLSRILQFVLRAMLQVSKSHLHQKYDLLHIHSVPDFVVFAGIVPRISGTPVILDIHDILPEFYTSKFGAKANSLSFGLLKIVEKLSAKFSSHVIIANHIWQERLISRSIGADKCTVVLNSPDRSIFYRRGAARKADGRFVLLYPGTLNWHQGLDLAVRAFARIRDQVPHADFYVYGDGPSKEDLSKMVVELGLQSRVFICEPLPLRGIPEIMESADLGIVPKRKDSFGNEAFSTKILEFMAMGVPVIVSDTQIDRYYFDDSVVRFFQGGDEEDLANAMLDMIRNGGKRKILAENATEFVKQIDWTAKKHEYLELVEQLLADPRKRTRS